MRIGVVDTESSHVDHLVRYCNEEHRAGDARVVLAASTGRDVGIPTVDEPEQLLGQVDAVVVFDRDGGRHAAHALPFLEAGLPVFVDKPFATDVGDAQAMIAAAEKHDALLSSYSPLRWFPEVRSLIELGAPASLVLTGPVDPQSGYAGIHFYGVHLADVAALLTKGELGPVHAVRTSDAIVATTTIGDSAITLNMVRPGSDPMPFRITHAVAGTVTTLELPLGRDYLFPALDALFAMLRSGVAPIPYADLVRPVQLLAEVDRALS